jgi:hypothetical protein
VPLPTRVLIAPAASPASAIESASPRLMSLCRTALPWRSREEV